MLRRKHIDVEKMLQVPAHQLKHALSKEPPPTRQSKTEVDKYLKYWDEMWLPTPVQATEGLERTPEHTPEHMPAHALEPEPHVTPPHRYALRSKDSVLPTSTRQRGLPK